MGTKTKPTARLMSHIALAALVGLKPRTLRRRVAAGEWPEPHSIVGWTWLYRADQVEHYIETGAWPEGTRFKAGEGKGREMT